VGTQGADCPADPQVHLPPRPGLPKLPWPYMFITLYIYGYYYMHISRGAVYKHAVLCCVPDK